MKHWPWSKCDKTLADAGFELKLLPGARSDIMTFKTNSNSLNQAKLVALEKDLKENLIQLGPIQHTQATQAHNINQTQPDFGIDTLNPTHSGVNAGSHPNNSIDTLNQNTSSFNRHNTNIIEPHRNTHNLDPSSSGNM